MTESQTPGLIPGPRDPWEKAAVKEGPAHLFTGIRPMSVGERHWS
jgi:hypothetical protein